MCRLCPARFFNAPDQFVRKKVVTTTRQYDSDGNVIQKNVDGAITTYLYDYSNRLIALGSGGASTTYAYDAFGAHVLTVKWYSVASSTGSGAKYFTTTELVFSGDTLLSLLTSSSRAATRRAQLEYFIFIPTISAAQTSWQTPVELSRKRLFPLWSD